MTYEEAINKFKRLRDSINFCPIGHKNNNLENLKEWSDDQQWQVFVSEYVFINNQAVAFNKKYGL